MLIVMLVFSVMENVFQFIFLSLLPPLPSPPLPPLDLSINQQDTWFPIHWLTYISEVFLTAKFLTALYIWCWSVLTQPWMGWEGRRIILYTNGGQCQGYVYKGPVLHRAAVIFTVVALSSLYILFKWSSPRLCLSDTVQSAHRFNLSFMCTVLNI